MRRPAGAPSRPATAVKTLPGKAEGEVVAIRTRGCAEVAVRGMSQTMQEGEHCRPAGQRVCQYDSPHKEQLQHGHQMWQRCAGECIERWSRASLPAGRRLLGLDQIRSERFYICCRPGTAIRCGTICNGRSHGWVMAVPLLLFVRSTVMSSNIVQQGMSKRSKRPR